MGGIGRHGSVVVVVIIIIAIVAIVGGAAWWFVLRSTPEKTVARMLQAQRAGDQEAVKRCLTERSQRYAAGATRLMAGPGADRSEYRIGESTIEGDTAKVPVIFPVPQRLAQRTGRSEITVTYVLHNEAGGWKVDLQDTMRALLGGLLEGMGAPPP